MNSLKIISLPEAFRQDPGGWSFAPLKNKKLIDQLEVDWTTFHTVSMEPETIRGNHFHPQVTEWLFFCGGPLLLAWQDEGSAIIQKKLIENSHTFLIIPPGVKHAVKNESPGTLVLVAFRSPGRSFEEPEVLPSLLIE
jgi:oxalate decarboxylase/phosphoglucose isomerase-like protein (cupin superfamily)